MIQLDNFELYLAFKTALRSNPTIQKLSDLHQDFAKLVFINSSCKKLKNQDLTILHLLCKTHNLSLFEELLSKDPELFEDLINRPNIIGWTPIYFAIKRNDLPFVQCLISHQASLKPAKFASPLILACQKASQILFNLILSKTDLETLHYQDTDGITALFMSIYTQNIDYLQLLFEKHHINPRIFDKSGASLLHWASNDGNIKILTYVIENMGLKDLINHQDLEGNAPLHFAARYCEESEFFEALLAAGADLKLVNKAGETAEEVAFDEENVFGREILNRLSGGKVEQGGWCGLI